MVTHGTDGANVRPRIHWGGILAGVLAGVVTYAALTVLGLALGILASGGLTLGQLALAALAYLALTTGLSAYLAGLTAARAASFLTPAQGRFNGLLTGMLLLALLTWGLSSALSRGVSAAANLVGSAAQAAGGAGGLEGTFDSLGLGEQYRALVGGFDREQLVEVLAQALPELSQQQVAAAVEVVLGVLQSAQRSIASADPQLGEVVQRQFDRVSQALQGPELARRLERRGLSQAQAQEVARVLQQRFAELRTQAQQTVDTAAKAAGTAAWTWLLLAGAASWGGSRGGEAAAEKRQKPGP